MPESLKGCNLDVSTQIGAMGVVQIGGYYGGSTLLAGACLYTESNKAHHMRTPHQIVPYSQNTCPLHLLPEKINHFDIHFHMLMTKLVHLKYTSF